MYVQGGPINCKEVKYADIDSGYVLSQLPLRLSVFSTPVLPFF